MIINFDDFFVVELEKLIKQVEKKFEKKCIDVVKSVQVEIFKIVKDFGVFVDDLLQEKVSWQKKVVCKIIVCKKKVGVCKFVKVKYCNLKDSL